MSGNYTIDDQTSRRISLLRFVLIILVVYLHSYNLTGITFEYGIYEMHVPLWMSLVQETISNIVARCAVPLLFLLSSLLLYAKPFNWLHNIGRKARTLLLPFLIWNSLWILAFFIAQSIPFFQPYFAGDEHLVAGFGPLEWLQAYFPLKSDEVFCPPLWFLSDLFRLNLLAGALGWLCKKLPALTLAVTGCLWLLDIEIYLVRNEALLFFVLGCFISQHGLRAESLDRLRWLDLGVVYAAGIALELWMGQSWPLLHKVNILVGCIFFIKLSKALAQKTSPTGVFARLAQYSFIIYVAHEYTQTLLKKLALIYLPREAWVFLLTYLLLPLLVIGLCLLLGFVLRRFLPPVYRVVTGSR